MTGPSGQRYLAGTAEGGYPALWSRGVGLLDPAPYFGKGRRARYAEVTSTFAEEASQVGHLLATEFRKLVASQMSLVD